MSPGREEMLKVSKDEEKRKKQTCKKQLLKKFSRHRNKNKMKIITRHKT